MSKKEDGRRELDIDDTSGKSQRREYGFGLWQGQKQLKYLIDEYVDHKLLIPAEHSFTKIHRNLSDGNVAVDFLRPKQGSIHLHCPPEAYAFVYSDEVNMQSVSDYLRQIIATHLPENVDGITLKLREEVINTPYYHYTHGLKKHDGNCQRIAHGHRSKVTVFENGVESIDWQNLLGRTLV